MKTLTLLVTVLATAFLAASCGALDEGGGSANVAKPGRNAAVVRVGYLHTIAVDDKLWLGQVEGQFAKAGLDIKTTEFATGIDVSQALAGGSIDVAVMGGVTSNFPAQGQGKVFMLNSIENATAQLWVQPGRGIRSVRDLKGRTILTTVGTTADIFLLRALSKAGLTRQQVTVVNAKMPDAVQAFASGAADAIALWVPFDLRVHEAVPKATMIDDAGHYPDAAVGDGWVANNTWYAGHRKTIAKLIGAWLKINTAFRDDPAGSLKKVYDVAYRNDATLSDLQHQMKYQTDYTDAQWLARYRDGDVLKTVGQAERAYVALGGVPRYVDPKTFFDTSLFIKADAGGAGQ